MLRLLEPKIWALVIGISLIIYICNVCKQYFMWGKYKWWSNIHVRDKNLIIYSFFLYSNWKSLNLCNGQAHWECTCTLTVNVIFHFKNPQNTKTRKNWKKLNFLKILNKEKGKNNHIICHEHEYCLTIYTFLTTKKCLQT